MSQTAQQSNRVRVVNTRRKTKFTFSDYGYSHFVRQKMLHALQQFDQDHNQLFDEEEIKVALVQILDEDPNELYYVIQNVFRYDKDNDKKVSYQQFINFSVEQHFGQLAIQRLHKQKVYSQGNKRIMNLPEFIKTLEYSLNTIDVHGSDQIYQLLFRQVDLDKDGFISYQDYFIFLKEYFGSLSPTDPVPPAPQPIPVPEPVEPQIPIDNGAAEKFARLIYSQIKISAMQADQNKNLSLQKPQIQLFLTEILQVSQEQKDQFSSFILQDKTQLSYEQFLQFIVPFYYCQYFISLNQAALANEPINLQRFIQIVSQASANIVAVPPSQKTLMSLFILVTGNTKSQLQLEQYVRLMGNIFQNFSFDRRGLARGTIH